MTATTEKLVKAYNQMLTATKDTIEMTKREAGPAILYAIDEAKEKVAETVELTNEEIDKVSDYLKRDLHDAADYIAVGERELGDWLRIDALYIEASLLDLFSHMVDETALELEQIKQNAEHVKFGVWHTGEVTSIGTLACSACGKIIHFKKTSYIPPCSKCENTEFNRGIEDETKYSFNKPKHHRSDS